METRRDAPVHRIDFREVLRKYITHVEVCEGVDFLEDYNRHDSDGTVTFTDQEWGALGGLRAVAGSTPPERP